MTARRGAYPGSFNPATVAHLAIAAAARDQCGLDEVHLVLSIEPLGKHGDPALAPLDARRRALDRVVAPHEWLSVTVTDAQLLADIAIGYDVVILGADKWNQVIDTAWYDDPAARDDALARLPVTAVAPRPPHPLPAADERHVILDIDPSHHAVSATAVRGGEQRWQAPEV